jgi:hypothetical protein
MPGHSAAREVADLMASIGAMPIFTNSSTSLETVKPEEILLELVSVPVSKRNPFFHARIAVA